MLKAVHLSLVVLLLDFVCQIAYFFVAPKLSTGASREAPVDNECFSISHTNWELGWDAAKRRLVAPIIGCNYKQNRIDMKMDCISGFLVAA